MSGREPDDRGGEAAIVRTLLRHGLLSAADVVDHRLVTRDLSSSNGLTMIERDGEGLLVVKHSRHTAQDWQGSMVQELAAYQLARIIPGAPFPRMLHSDPTMMVLEAVAPGTPLSGLAEFSAIAQGAAALGRALGGWHRATAAADVAVGVASQLGQRLPWPLLMGGVDRPALVDELEPRTRSLVWSHPQLLDQLERAGNLWQSSACVHGDVRLANALLDSGGDVVLVDWECAAWGDPGWDLAGAVADYTAAAMAVWPDADMATLLHLGGGPVQALEDAYLGSGGSASALDAARMLLPGRLVHVAFQYAVWGGADGKADAARLVALAVEAVQSTAVQSRVAIGVAQ